MTNLRTSGIYFDVERQAYAHKTRPDLVFRRCSEFVESFFDPFDGPAIALKLTTTHPKYSGRTVGELLAEWEGAAEEGTRVHHEVQRYVSEEREPENPRAVFAARWLDENFPAADYLREPEVALCEENLRIAGTADLLLLPRAGDRWVLLDWKTNKKIDMVPFRGKRGTRGPAQVWPDCHHFKYSLQLSLYRYLLEQRLGLRFDRQLLVHLTPEGARPIPCEYLPRHVEQMVDHDISGPALFAALDAL